MASLDHYREPGFCPEGGADRATLRLSTKGCEAILKQTTLILPDALCAWLPVPGSSRTSPLPQKKGGRGPAKRRPARCRATRFCPEGVGADLSAKGCEAILKKTTLILPDALCVPVWLPVPGSSRTSPLHKKREIADKRNVAWSTTQALFWGLFSACV
ncbi:hypothetical protein BKM03_02665 [Pseudomonas avellanae]|uniref:Uncharacterized protein n=1 Tax=Pseudomonas avellanae TaxID=46257 RepID=A0AAD0GQ50_9PSED|nr:hypothetical protein BKM03_02665 [Pseudomonas avellanae]POP80761.1 hypothetical protein CXB34_25170 [Pseudomonas amygdali pv. morsprunorum]